MKIAQGSLSSFGTSLFSELCAEFPHSNVLFSPLSVYQALALVNDGATLRSENKLEMKQLLGPKTIQSQALLLQKQSEENGANADVQLNIATSIWANGLKLSYIAGAQESQSADAFRLPETYTAVDKWIEEKTKGMITELMGDGELDPLTVALLVNCVHFKGTWTYEFDPNKTVNGKFTMRDQSRQNARYMTAHRKMQMIPRCEALGGADVLVLDYGKEVPESGPEFSTMFILPASLDDDSMKNVTSGLNSQPISQLLNKATMTEVRLKLPRFRLDFGPSKLKPFLQNMGMKVAFDRSVDGKFYRMSSDRGLYVEDVHHGACMEVSEKGTEAAASTVVVIKTRSAPRVYGLTFNRPFVIVVFHRPTGIPLFIGRVEDPVFSF
ncbi:hypothetical protein ACHAXR_011911 [Thalassiosira sp. AJA248-18]